MISFDDIRILLSSAPSGARLRIAANGNAVYALTDGLNVSEEINGQWVRLSGVIGEAQNVMSPGVIILKVESVDFIEVVG
jgi:hypothetical protein